MVVLERSPAFRIADALDFGSLGALEAEWLGGAIHDCYLTRMPGGGARAPPGSQGTLTAVAMCGLLVRQQLPAERWHQCRAEITEACPSVASTAASLVDLQYLRLIADPVALTPRP